MNSCFLRTGSVQIQISRLAYNFGIPKDTYISMNCNIIFQNKSPRILCDPNMLKLLCIVSEFKIDSQVLHQRDLINLDHVYLTTHPDKGSKNRRQAKESSFPSPTTQFTEFNQEQVLGELACLDSVISRLLC